VYRKLHKKYQSNHLLSFCRRPKPWFRRHQERM